MHFRLFNLGTPIINPYFPPSFICNFSPFPINTIPVSNFTALSLTNLSSTIKELAGLNFISLSFTIKGLATFNFTTFNFIALNFITLDFITFNFVTFKCPVSKLIPGMYPISFVVCFK